MINGVRIVNISFGVSSGDNMENLALKYRPKEFSDVTEQSTVVSMLESMCQGEDLPNRNFLLVGPRGCGKAQPLHSLVFTVDGFIRMKDVKPGVEVFTGSGNIAKVKDVYPQGQLPTYQITFDDCTSIEVAENHLNEIGIVRDYDYDYDSVEWKTIDTKELIATYRELQPNEELITYCPRVNWAHKDTVDLSIEILVAIMERFENSYLCNSQENRLKLFCTFAHHGPYEYKLVKGQNLATTVINFSADDANLSNAFAFLARSLDCKDTITFAQVEDMQIYRHNIVMPQYVYDALVDAKDITAKVDTPFKHIIDITYLGEQECQCIMVDHDDHTYITDGFTPTHNTTLGRIVADKINEGQGTPIEIDAASHSGVDTVRDIITQAATYPIGTKYKVFICDEVHAFSQNAWSALLKTIEEQPAKSVFILLTTNPEKIPETIISRVQVFRLSNISLAGLESRLKYVLDQEISEGRAINYNDDAIAYLAKLAKGGMRDALTLLDKALVYSNDLTLENLSQALNLPDYDDFFDLLNAYAKKDHATTMSIISKVYNSGTNFVRWFEGFQSFVVNIAKYVFVKDLNKTMIPGYYQDKVANYGMKHAEICLELSQILIDVIAKISKSEYVEEIAISYLCRKR